MKVKTIYLLNILMACRPFQKRQSQHNILNELSIIYYRNVCGINTKLDLFIRNLANSDYDIILYLKPGYQIT